MTDEQIEETMIALGTLLERRCGRGRKERIAIEILSHPHWTIDDIVQEMYEMYGWVLSKEYVTKLAWHITEHWAKMVKQAKDQMTAAV